MPLLCCEGPICNNGRSAAEREAVPRRGYESIPLYDEAIKRARLDSTRALLVTPHSSLGADRRGHYLYQCDRCGHERVYGNSESHYMFQSEQR